MSRARWVLRRYGNRVGDECDWHTDHAVLQPGEPEVTTTTVIESDRLPLATLTDALDPALEAGRVYLLGTAAAKGAMPVPPTLEVSGETVTFNYATPDALDDWRPTTLRQVALTVQIRHAPNATPPAFALPDRADTPATPGPLQRWIPTR